LQSFALKAYTQKSFLSGLFGMSLLWFGSSVKPTPFGFDAGPVNIDILLSPPIRSNFPESFIKKSKGFLSLLPMIAG